MQRAQLTKESFANLATTEDGARLCKEIIAKFLKRVSGTPKYKINSDRLFAACPSMHNQLDVLYSEAMENMMMAQVTKDRISLNSSMQGFKKYFDDSGQIHFRLLLLRGPNQVFFRTVSFCGAGERVCGADCSQF